MTERNGEQRWENEGGPPKPEKPRIVAKQDRKVERWRDGTGRFTPNVIRTPPKKP